MTQRHFPAGTCDTHMHIYDSRYPVAPTSLLRPPDATVDHYRRVQACLGLQRVVVVQPTTYGFDNSCTLDAVAELGGEARAIVVVDDRTTDPQLEQLARLGMPPTNIRRSLDSPNVWFSIPLNACCGRRTGRIRARPVPRRRRISADWRATGCPTSRFDAAFSLITPQSCTSSSPLHRRERSTPRSPRDQ